MKSIYETPKTTVLQLVEFEEDILYSSDGLPSIPGDNELPWV